MLAALGTAMRRGELIGLRWRSVNLLEAKIEVRETFVRGRFIYAQEQSVEARRRSSAGGTARRPRGAVAQHRLPQRRRSRLRPSDEGDAGRHEQAREALPQAGARACGHREALPPLPRPTPHLSHSRRRGQPADLRSGASRPFARLDHRALHARGSTISSRAAEKSEARMETSPRSAIAIS